MEHKWDPQIQLHGMYILNHIHVQQAKNLTEPNRGHPHIKTCLSFDRPCTICNFLFEKFNYLLTIIFITRQVHIFTSQLTKKQLVGLPQVLFLPRCHVPTHKWTNYLYCFSEKKGEQVLQEPMESFSITWKKGNMLCKIKWNYFLHPKKRRR